MTRLRTTTPARSAACARAASAASWAKKGSTHFGRPSTCTSTTSRSARATGSRTPSDRGERHGPIAALHRRSFHEGCRTASLYGNVIRTLMPLSVTDAELEEGLDVLESCLADTA